VSGNYEGSECFVCRRNTPSSLSLHLQVVRDVGLIVGDAVELLDGDGLRLLVGLSVDRLVGLSVGFWVRLSVGFLVGLGVGFLVGLGVGFLVELSVGFGVGFLVGLGVIFVTHMNVPSLSSGHGQGVTPCATMYPHMSLDDHCLLYASIKIADKTGSPFLV
jgi:hypothetical protein